MANPFLRHALVTTDQAAGGARLVSASRVPKGRHNA